MIDQAVAAQNQAFRLAPAGAGKNSAVRVFQFRPHLKAIARHQQAARGIKRHQARGRAIAVLDPVVDQFSRSRARADLLGGRG